MALNHIDPVRAADLIKQGAILVDIREVDEHARENIPGVLHRPLAGLARLDEDAPALIFHCRSGNRTAANAGKLAAAANCQAYMLEGGLDAWRAAGLPVHTNPTQPIEIIRQVQITAGLLILLGVVLGWLVSPLFLALSGGVGAGLVFAGVTGSCAMARLLGILPWNRRAARR
jgi:rhodanese-related sulfurtransferase